MSPHKYLYTNFHSSFLHNRQNTRNNPNDHQLMNKQSLIYPDHGILSSIKRNYQCSKTMWMNLKTIMLSERRQTQKITCCNIPLTRNSGKDKKKKNHSDRKQVSVCQGLAGERTNCKGTQGNISGWQKFPYHDLLYLYHDCGGGGGDTTIYSSENYSVSLWSHVWKLKKNHSS